MRRAFKIIGWTIGSLGLLFGLSGMAVYLFVSSNYVRTQIENRAGLASGQKTKIASLSIDWGWTSRVHPEGVGVANADWSKADHMFKAERIEVDVRVWPLLHGDI